MKQRLKGSNSNLRKYMYYFGFAMVCVYVCVGLLLVLFPIPLLGISSGRRIAIGVVLMLYGLARGFLRYRKRHQDPDFDDDILDRNL